MTAFDNKIGQIWYQRIPVKLKATGKMKTLCCLGLHFAQSEYVFVGDQSFQISEINAVVMLGSTFSTMHSAAA